MKQVNKLASLLLNQKPIYLANDGNSIDQITIRYKDYYLFVDIDSASGRPTGDFGWSEDPTMNPLKNVRDILTVVDNKGEVQ